MARRLRSGLVLLGCTVAGSIACITPPPESPASGSAKDKSSSATTTAPKGRQVLWDGEGKGATAKGWASCAKKEGCKATLDAASKVGRDGSTGLKFHVDGPEWTGMGWNWFGWYPETAGTDISKSRSLSFFIRVQAKKGDDAPEYPSFSVKLVCSGKGKKGTAEVNIGSYTDDLSDGNWHEVVVPLAELYKGSGADFDPTTAWEFDFSTYAQKPKTFDVFIDDIAVDDREVLAWISLPVPRAPAPLGKDPAVATAEVNLDAAGTPINPFIYGISNGDQEVLAEMGVTTRRVGGNKVSPYDWKTGFTSLGADWFFQNRKDSDAKHPEHNQWAEAFRADKKYGITSYLTLPSMGWVAKDDTANGFPKPKYPDQMEFAGDRPESGNGKMLAKDKDGNPVKNEKGEPKII
jgi:hypothetical protein